MIECSSCGKCLGHLYHDFTNVTQTLGSFHDKFMSSGFTIDPSELNEEYDQYQVWGDYLLPYYNYYYKAGKLVASSGTVKADLIKLANELMLSNGDDPASGPDLNDYTVADLKQACIDYLQSMYSMYNLRVLTVKGLLFNRKLSVKRDLPLHKHEVLDYSVPLEEISIPVRNCCKRMILCDNAMLANY